MRENIAYVNIAKSIKLLSACRSCFVYAKHDGIIFQIDNITYLQITMKNVSDKKKNNS